MLTSGSGAMVEKIHHHYYSELTSLFYIPLFYPSQHASLELTAFP